MRRDEFGTCLSFLERIAFGCDAFVRGGGLRLCLKDMAAGRRDLIANTDGGVGHIHFEIAISNQPAMQRGKQGWINTVDFEQAGRPCRSRLRESPVVRSKERPGGGSHGKIGKGVGVHVYRIDCRWSGFSAWILGDAYSVKSAQQEKSLAFEGIYASVPDQVFFSSDRSARWQIRLVAGDELERRQELQTFLTHSGAVLDASFSQLATESWTYL